MRWLATSILAVLAVLAAACGGSREQEPPPAPPPRPDAEALGYFARDAAFVALLPSAPGDPLFGTLGRQLDGITGIATLTAKVRRLGAGLEPVLGAGRVAVGTLGRSLPGASQVGTPFLAAVVTKDGQQALGALERSGATRVGQHDDAVLLEDETTAYAVLGTTIVAARELNDVRAALDRRAQDRGMRERDFEALLPDGDAPVAFVAAPELLVPRLPPLLGGTPYARGIARIGGRLRVSAAEIDLTVRLDTSDAALTVNDLPFGSAGGPPEAPPPGPSVVLSVADGRRAVEWLQRALGERYDRVRDALARYGRVDLDRELTARISGGANVVLAPSGALLARTRLDDPGPLRGALSRIRAFAPLALPLAGLGDYELEERDGITALIRDGATVAGIGVGESGTLVAGTATAPELAALARVPLAPASARAPMTGHVPGATLRAALPALPGIPSDLLPLGDGVLSGRADASRTDLRLRVPVAP